MSVIGVSAVDVALLRRAAPPIACNWLELKEVFSIPNSCFICAQASSGCVVNADGLYLHGFKMYSIIR